MEKSPHEKRYSRGDVRGPYSFENDQICHSRYFHVRIGLDFKITCVV